MSNCINSKIGSLIHAYELNALNEENCEKFELHLMECEFCFNEIKRFENEAVFFRSSDEIKQAIVNDYQKKQWERIKSKIIDFIPFLKDLFYPFAIRTTLATSRDQASLRDYTFLEINLSSIRELSLNELVLDDSEVDSETEDTVVKLSGFNPTLEGNEVIVLITQKTELLQYLNAPENPDTQLIEQKIQTIFKQEKISTEWIRSFKSTCLAHYCTQIDQEEGEFFITLRLDREKVNLISSESIWLILIVGS